MGMEQLNNPEDFFYYLLNKTKEEFIRTPIYKKQVLLNRNWNYAVCATPIQKGKGVIFGINWGGDCISAQTKYPTGENIWNYTFIQQSKELLKRYLAIEEGTHDFNYTNLCFFRSPKLTDLSQDDFRISLSLFQEFIEFINPEWVLSFGSTNIKILYKSKHITEVKGFNPEVGKRFRGHSAILFNKFPFYSLPHPQAHMSGVAREQLWAKVIESMC